MYIVYHKDLGDDPILTEALEQIYEPESGQVAFVTNLDDVRTWLTADDRNPLDYEVSSLTDIPFIVERKFDIHFEHRVPPRPPPSELFKKA